MTEACVKLFLQEPFQRDKQKSTLHATQQINKTKKNSRHANNKIMI